MRVVIVHDPTNPGRNGAVEDIDDGLARLLIRDGLAREARPYEHDQAAPAATPEPGPVAHTERRDWAAEGGAAS